MEGTEYTEEAGGTVATAKRPGNTTVSLKNQTKKMFDAYLEQRRRGGEPLTADDAVFELLQSKINPELPLGDRPRRLPLPESYDIDLSEDLDPLRAEIAELRGQLDEIRAMFAGLDQHSHVLVHPEHGFLVDATRADYTRRGSILSPGPRIDFPGHIEAMKEADGHMPAGTLDAVHEKLEARKAREAQEAIEAEATAKAATAKLARLKKGRG